MPFTGFDPLDHGGPTDVSGGGINPSYYYLMSPGGRFPGDVNNFLEYLASRSSGETADPDYEVPSWAANLPGWLGRMARFHEWNVNNNGPGTVPDPIGGYPYHFFSGPGAQYGPPGGPLHGLADQGEDRILDGPDYPATGGGNGGGGGRRGGGGKGYNGPQGLPVTDRPKFPPWDHLKIPPSS